MVKDIQNNDSLISSTYFKEIFNQAGIGIMVLKNNKTIEFANIEGINIFGYESGKLDGIKFTKLFHKSH